ncbi:MAG: 50S ribosomal protein L13 [Bacilli bacterium]|jgi:large subunit ribosomal protein L13|nr:50S ribosomal protein L13 [Bacilli bacterium]MDY0063854.1 50S ribosomal protein L13 [Bacilli bacterium]
MNKSYMANNQTVERQWHVIDAENLVLGRLATEAASLLRGKHKPTYTNHVDCGDYVIVVNAEKVALTGNKLQGKLYHHHTGFNSGLRTRTAQKMLETQPQKIVELAIKGMLPKTKLGNAMYTKLFVYCGPEHPHQAQKPVAYQLKG